MKVLLAVCLSGGLLVGTALTADRPAERTTPPASTAPAAAASRPAEGARPMRGPRGRRLPDGGALRESRPPGSDEPLTPEQVEQVMRFCRENFPQVHVRLERLRQVDPAEFRDILRRMRARLQVILDAKSHDPQLAQKLIEEHRLQISIMELGRRYRQARSEPEKSRIGNELARLLQKRFELTQEHSRQEIDNLRHRLDEQARRLAERESHKEQILRREFERVTSRPRLSAGQDAD